MKDYATFLVFGTLCLLGCSCAGDTPPTPATSAGTGAGVATKPPAAISSASAGAGSPGASAGQPAPAIATMGGSSASGVAGATTSTVSAGSPAIVATGGAGMLASAGTAAASGAGGMPSTGGSGGSSALGGSGAATEPSFQSVYNNVLLMMCPSCHMAGGVFGSPDLSTPELAYSSLVNKDPLAAMPGVCGGKGKLVTPGNCETSLLYNKISQATPTCGRRMPLASSTVPQSGIDELCAWIRAGAKQN